MGVLLNFWASFLAGLFAPIGAVCVLPLYPGFLAYLSSKLEGLDEFQQKSRSKLFGWIIALGVVLSMFIFGLIFSAILKQSLTNAIGIISPIAFGILGIISLFLIFNFDFARLFPKKAHSPILENPYWSSLLFGLFFGAIVLPCNPASLAVLFAISFTVGDFLINLVNFVLFGFGMALPLIILAYVSSSQNVVSWLVQYKRRINLVAGIIMLGISLYYLIFVFRIFG